MPAKSAKQERFMQAVAHNPAFAKKVGVSQSVGREFTKGSEMKAKKYADGGMPSQSNKGGAMRGLERAAAMSGRTMPSTGKPATAGKPVGMKSGGYTRAADGIAAKGKTKGKIVKMAMGGLPEQAAARAGQALAARAALPSQAQGVRPFKKGGRAKACK